MFKYLCLFILAGFVSNSQTHLSSPSEFKGDHFVIYNKCKAAVLFCESTQQIYTFCGASKNCQGLYVNPGDTLFLNYEDKFQVMNIVSDITFQGYIPSVSNYTFLPVQNCIPPQALQIIIPLSAVPGSSFQINAQNPGYYPAESFLPWVPLPIYVYVGGQQPNYTTALAGHTNCPVPEQADTTLIDVSVKETQDDHSVSLYPNPTKGIVTVEIGNTDRPMNMVVYDSQGRDLWRSDLKNTTIDVGNLEDGFYYISFYSNKRQIKTTKLIIAK